MRRCFPLSRCLLTLAAAIILTSLFSGPAAAKDYPITFLKETYKANTAAGTPARVYHTWAVETGKGNRLLVLEGSDSIKRQWLREFVKTGTSFIITVPDKETGRFETETIFKIDVTNVHPVDEAFLGGKKKKKKKRK